MRCLHSLAKRSPLDLAFASFLTRCGVGPLESIVLVFWRHILNLRLANSSTAALCACFYRHRTPPPRALWSYHTRRVSKKIKNRNGETSRAQPFYADSMSGVEFENIGLRLSWNEVLALSVDGVGAVQ